MMDKGNLTTDATGGAKQPHSPDGNFAAVPLRARFESKYVVQEDGCWRWTGWVGKYGHGTLWHDGRMAQAHRIAYELFVGEIPSGWVVSHVCLNNQCVNPAHLVAQEKPRQPERELKPYNSNIYNSPRWKAAREAALLRDGRRCTVARFFGETCNGVLHVHHIVPLNDGGDPFDLDNLGTACARHHAQWEALRTEVVRSLSDTLRHRLRCPHHHVSAESRRICEARLARRSGAIAA